MEKVWSVRRPSQRACLHLALAIAIINSVFSQSDSIENVYVTEGEDKILECHYNPEFESHSPAHYWLRTNRNDRDNVAIEKVTLDNHYKVELSPAEGKYSLFIHNTTYSKDNGKFECKLKESGTGYVLHSQTFQLTVLIPPSPPEITPSNATATEGRPFQLTCSSRGGSPDPEIKWYKAAGSSSSSLEGTYQPGGSKDVPTVNILTINPSRDDDGMEYICVVQSKALELNQGSKLENSVRLNVNYIPRITIQPHNPLKVELGTLDSATCRVDAKPPPTSIKWTHNGRVVSNGANLSIKPSSSDDSGVYTCVADNGLGTPGQEDLNVDVLYGPTIQMESKKEVKEHEDVVVRCSVTSNPPADIQWFKEGDPNFRSSGDKLKLKDISVNSMGRYICQASNELYPSSGKTPIRKVANATVAIWIKHPPGKATIYPENAIAVEGESITLSCRADPPGWPEPIYKWWKDTPTNNSLPSGQNFTITQARAGNEGTYGCQVFNDIGQGSIATVSLKVYEPPRLVTPLQPQLIKRALETDFSVFCIARAKPRPSAYWFKNNQPLNTSWQYEISTNGTTEKNGISIVRSVLRFLGPDRQNKNQLTADDRGIYTCKFENEVRSTSSNMSLKIEHGPILRHTNKKVAFDVQSKAILECRMLAYPEPTFEWSFGKTAIVPVPRKYEMSQDTLGDDLYVSRLSIYSLQQSEYGEYTCSASNSIDSTRTHIHLVERGPPEAPTDLRVVNVSINEITLQWNEGFNGGYPDTKYWILSGQQGIPDKQTDCGTTNVCTIRELQDMKIYNFRVQASNDKGVSSMSGLTTAQTKVNEQNIPQPAQVYYSKDSWEVTFKLLSDKDLPLVGKVEVWSNGKWQDFQDNIPISNKIGSVIVEQAYEESPKVQVLLCIKNESSLCGMPVEATAGFLPPMERKEQSASSTTLIIIIVCSVIGAALILGIIVLCCCCYRRNSKEKAIKKDYEMEAPNARPKAITGPYYPEGIVNKGVENSMDMDEAVKNGVYTTNQSVNGTHSPNGHLPNHHMQNGGNIHPGYSYMDHDNSNNGGSVDSQDSLWMKANGEMGNDRSYSYDPSLSNAYLYPDDYHHMHEDMMNQRNREHLYNGDPYAAVNKPKKRNVEHLDSYHDVSDLPDPYMEEEDKMPHNSLSFDESLESGYSTPNSRSRRVIREIIV